MGCAVTNLQSYDYDAAIDRAISTCNGDIHGALRALLMLNEQLEAQLAALSAKQMNGVSHDRAA